jgi:ribonuclease HI
VKAISNLNAGEKIRICGDSNIVCNMVAKKWGWKKKKWLPHKKAPHLKTLLDKTLNLLANYNYEVKWIPREENEEADILSKSVLIEAGIIKPDLEIEQCPNCNGKLMVRNGKFGKFYGCSNYPKCRFTKK